MGKSIIMIMAHIKTSLVVKFHPRRTEWMCAIIVGLCGVVLHANATLMADHAQAYKMMTMFATQPHWSYLLMGLGVVRIVVLLVNGLWRKSPHARAFMSIICCLPYWSIAASFSDAFGLAMVLSWGVLATEMYNALAASADAKDSDYGGGSSES